MKKIIFEEWILLFVLLIQVTLVCSGVISRYFFEWSISFTEEISRYLLVWLACLGFSACQAKGEMIGFDFPSTQETKWKKLRNFIKSITTFVFFGILFFSSYKMIHLQWMMGNKTAVMGWPMIWVSLALPIGCILLIYRLIKGRID